MIGCSSRSLIGSAFDDVWPRSPTPLSYRRPIYQIYRRMHLSHVFDWDLTERSSVPHQQWIGEDVSTVGIITYPRLQQASHGHRVTGHCCTRIKSRPETRPGLLPKQNNMLL